MEWKYTNKELPRLSETRKENSVPCLVYKRYDRTDKDGEIKSFYQIQILMFNHFHKCWDQEDGDDYDCDIEQVEQWMYLPDPNRQEQS